METGEEESVISLISYSRSGVSRGVCRNGTYYFHGRVNLLQGLRLLVLCTIVVYQL